MIGFSRKMKPSKLYTQHLHRIRIHLVCALTLALLIVCWSPSVTQAAPAGGVMVDVATEAAPAETVLAGGTITTDTRLTLDNSPYRVTGILYFQKDVTLTVEPGVVVRFDANTGLVVRGTLVAVGSAAKPITFSGTSPTPGSWRGIRMEGTSTAPLIGSVLEHVIVEYGGGAISYAANLYLAYTTITINQSTFRHGNRDGIYGFNGGTVHMTHSHFAGNARYAVYLADGSLDPTLGNLTAADNGVDGVAIGGTLIRSNQLWEFSGLPYIISESKTVQAKGSLTLAPGVELRFEENKLLDVKGTLNAAGTAAAPIRFTGTAAESSWWVGLRVLGTVQVPAVATLEHVTVEHAGRWSDGANLQIYNANVVIRQSRFHNGRLYGMLVQRRGRVEITGSMFTNNGGYALLLDQDAPSPRLNNLAMTDNGINGVGVRGQLQGEHTWQAIGYPYIVDESVNVPADSVLTLEPGVDVRFTQDTGLSIQGRLVAVGTEGAPIRFTGTNQSSGWWQGIRLTDQTASAFLEFCEIAYGGSAAAAQSLLSLGNSRAMVQNCHIHHSAAEGIRVSTGSGAFLRGNRIEANAFGVRNTGPADQPLDARGNWWGHESGPFHPTLNPNGQGNAASDGVLFDPWLRRAEDEAAKELIVWVLGPETFVPGSTQTYAIAYTNATGQTVQDAVLMVALPSYASYVDDSGGGILWPERHQLFWKLGDLAPGAMATVALQVRYRWGIPTGTRDAALAFLNGANLEQTEFAVQPYLDYVPTLVVGETLLGQAEVEAERRDYPDLDQHYSQATAAGFRFSIAHRLTLGDGRQVTRIVLLRFQPYFAATILQRQADRVLALVVDQSSFSLHRSQHVLRYHLQTGEWEELAPAAGAASAANISWGECMKNCILKEVPEWILTNTIKSINTAAKALACTRAPAGNPTDIADCGQLVKEIPGLSEVLTIEKCVIECNDDPESHVCTGDVKVCDSNDWLYGKLRGLDVIKTYKCLANGQYSWRPQEIEKCLPRGCSKCVMGPSGPYCKTVKRPGGIWGEIESRMQSLDPSQRLAIAGPSAANAEPQGTELVLLASGSAGRCGECVPAHDPNAKYGPEGDLLPGQLVTYTITYENEGAGAAYGVFVLDRLGEHFDAPTLAVYAGGDFIGASRTLFWDVGTLAPKGQPGSTGVVSFTVRLKEGLPSGTVIANQAVVHFPSVPEVTPTNTLVNLIQPLAAVPQSLETEAGQSLAIALQGRDISGPPLAFTLVEGPAYGTLTGTAPQLSYTPAASFTGQDRFSFSVSNGISTSRPALVLIQVHPAANDTTPPQVLWTLPAPDATAVAVSDEARFADEDGLLYTPVIQIQFSETINHETLTAGSVRMSEPDGQPLPLAIGYDGELNRAFLLPRVPLQAGTQYTVAVTRAVTDLRHNPLPTDHVWRFHTAGRTAPSSLYLPLLQRQ